MEYFHTLHMNLRTAYMGVRDNRTPEKEKEYAEAMSALRVRSMDTLRNGAWAMFVSPRKGHVDTELYVLAFNNIGTPHPWVTWAMGPDGECFWGHYFGTFDDAIEDFFNRINN